MAESITRDPGSMTPDPDVEHDGSADSWDSEGLRRLVLGAIVAILAPLVGFLGGSMVGTSADGTLDPMFAWMFAGLAVGAAGALLAFLGGLRWVGANRRRL